MLGESDGTTGNATIEQIGRRRTFAQTLHLALVLALVQWPMRAAVRAAVGSAIACEVVLAGQLEWDLEQYAVEHSDFPRRTTGDQFYDEWDFEAYRALGYTLTQSLTDHHRVTARLADL